jgi:hypothetical protein
VKVAKKGVKVAKKGVKVAKKGVKVAKKGVKVVKKGVKVAIRVCSYPHPKFIKCVVRIQHLFDLRCDQNVYIVYSD